ncbi:excisionase family DNA binding protein [Pseudonocardia cypriaca]|uniref:Excisionase family DNA binding protein n=1 Tax=Pseudonocardia cypriaca TaxID=882449 RepID=A0A543FYE1_9PSEU|nr:excisionase family DNA binding protein [Pseudonocardia cypriaca]
MSSCGSSASNRIDPVADRAEHAAVGRPDDQPLLTTAELARRLNVTSGTVQRWVRTGRIRPTLVTPGNQFRFNLDDVLEQLSQPRKRPD